MTAKDLKQRTLKIWELLLRAEDAAIHGLYAEAWKHTYEAMALYQPIVDPIMNGEIIPAKKGGRA